MMKWFLSYLFSAILLLLPPHSPAAEIPVIPRDAFGIVSITFVKAGHLPFLHGLKGEGVYLTHDTQGNLCQVSPVPLVAGGFNSRRASFGAGQPIELVIYDAELSKRLQTGRKIVSVDYDVSVPEMTEHGDIEIRQGLTLEEGFILHPRKAWSSWFGYAPAKLQCTPLI